MKFVFGLGFQLGCHVCGDPHASAESDSGRHCLEASNRNCGKRLSTEGFSATMHGGHGACRLSVNLAPDVNGFRASNPVLGGVILHRHSFTYASNVKNIVIQLIPQLCIDLS